jgi:hypothetical protein
VISPKLWGISLDSLFNSDGRSPLKERSRAVWVQYELGISGSMVFDDVLGFVAAFFTAAQER